MKRFLGLLRVASAAGEPGRTVQIDAERAPGSALCRAVLVPFILSSDHVTEEIRAHAVRLDVCDALRKENTLDEELGSLAAWQLGGTGAGAKWTLHRDQTSPGSPAALK